VKGLLPFAYLHILKENEDKRSCLMGCPTDENVVHVSCVLLVIESNDIGIYIGNISGNVNFNNIKFVSNREIIK